MAEKPILFSGEMVRAILDGRKTQTRRVIKPQPERVGEGWMYAGQYFADDAQMQDYLFHEVYGNGKCPYGGVYGDGTGDLLWVRETFAHKDEWTKPAYRADWKTPDKAIETMGAKWRPSIHMPRWASRLTLRVVDVRVERVQEISEEDARAEGVNLATWELHHRRDDSISLSIAAIEEFKQLWDSINAKRGHSWDSNPWVWVVEFKMV